MSSVLSAAALTYVAAFISSLGYFLYFLLRMVGGSRE
jgi:Zn-dependent membrane protease YugP